jgi:hypothetical protein
MLRSVKITVVLELSYRSQEGNLIWSSVFVSRGRVLEYRTDYNNAHQGSEADSMFWDSRERETSNVQTDTRTEKLLRPCIMIIAAFAIPYTSDVKLFTNFPAFYEARMFIVVNRKSRHLSLS